MLHYADKPVNLAHTGAIIPVRLGVPELPPIETMGLIDTGATICMIHADLAHQLNLTACGTTRISTVTSNSVECPQYRVRIEFPQGVYVDVVAASTTWRRKRYACIIGRDALKHGMLMYNGSTNSFMLIF